MRTRIRSRSIQGKLQRRWQVSIGIRSLVRQCATEAIYIRWIGGEKLKNCSACGNLRCVGFHHLLNLKLLQYISKMIEHKMKYRYRYIKASLQNTYSLPSLSIAFPVSHKDKNKEWISGGDTADFNRLNINTNAGAVSEHLSHRHHMSICATFFMFVPWSHVGLAFVEWCKDIRVLVYSNG